MLQEVRMWGDDRAAYGWRDQLFVDAHGILRLTPNKRRKPAPFPPGKKVRGWDEVDAWADGRRVGGQGGARYWYLIARHCAGCRGQACCCPRSDGKPVHGPHAHFRQGGRLTDSELAFWNSLVDWMQERYAFLPTHEGLRSST
jgi:hypothetical protein